MITFKFEGIYKGKSLSPENMNIAFLKDIIDTLDGKLIPKNCTVALKKGSACLQITEEQTELEEKRLFKINEKKSPKLTESKVNECIKNCNEEKTFNSQWNDYLCYLREKLDKHNTSCDIITNDGFHLKINKNTPILTEKNLWHKTTKYVYGEIIDIGGSNPNIHIKDETLQKKIIIDIDKEEIKKVKENILYQKKSIYISCSEHELTGEIKNCKFISWDDYDPDYVKENFEKYREERKNKFKENWDFENIKKNYDGNTDKWLNDIRYGKPE